MCSPLDAYIAECERCGVDVVAKFMREEAPRDNRRLGRVGSSALTGDGEEADEENLEAQLSEEVPTNEEVRSLAMGSESSTRQVAHPHGEVFE